MPRESSCVDKRTNIRPHRTNWFFNEVMGRLDNQVVFLILSTTSKKRSVEVDDNLGTEEDLDLEDRTK